MKWVVNEGVLVALEKTKKLTAVTLRRFTPSQLRRGMGNSPLCGEQGNFFSVHPTFCFKQGDCLLELGLEGVDLRGTGRVVFA